MKLIWKMKKTLLIIIKIKEKATSKKAETKAKATPKKAESTKK